MIKFHNNKFIGADVLNCSNFTLDGSDSFENYVKNLETQPEDWIYRTKEISYQRNSFGHRSKEIEKLNDKYILFAGCSITFGSGLSLEDTYPYIVSKKFNLDYYNLSVEASGPDTLTTNMFSWFKNVKNKPVCVVFQWPEPYRFFYSTDDPKILLGPWVSYIKKYYDKEILNSYNKVVSTEILDHFSKIMKHNIYAMLEVLEIPYHSFNLSNNDIIDRARDLKHPGIETNKIISQKIINSLSMKIV
jgi:hypothetical protein